MMRYKDRVALVTGGGSGIGRATALAFAKEGASVVVSDIQEAGGYETVSQIQKMGGTALFVRADVSQASDVARLVQKTVDTYHRLDVAFNNAGIEGVPSQTADCSEQDWDRTLAINLKGAFLCMKYEIPQMLKQGGGAIVNCSSIAGLVGFAGSSAYVASKHGMVGLTKSAALEYIRSGIRVNAVCPGVIHTAMIDRYTKGKKEVEAQLTAAAPIGRMGTPEEIANSVLWLCSDEASFVTGQAIAVDGGWIVQ